MRAKQFSKLLMASAAILATAACGGGGSGVAFAPPPPVTPTPTPTPAPAPAPTTPQAPFGLTSSQQFATFGVTASDIAQYVVEPGDPNAIKFSWSDTDKTYNVTVPGLAPARLSMTFPGNNPVAFTGTDANGNKLPVAFSVYYPAYGPIKYSYSSLGFYSTYPDNATNPYVWAQFVYGIATLAGEVPKTGTANYDAQVFGITTSGNGYDITGDARLTFDFGAGSLTGYMQPRLFSDWDGVDRALGQYDFKQTVYSAGSTTFSGKFVIPGGGERDSTFQGQFTGPNAAELIAGFQAPYLDPFDSVWKTMGGVWIGKKQ